MRQLPVFSAFTHALKSVWHNLPFAFFVSLPWLIILVPINVWAELHMPDFDPANIRPEQLPEIQQGLIQFYLSTFFSMVIYASIAVMWHRYILKDEAPAPRARLRLDGTVWRYVGNTFLVGLMALLSVLPIALALTALVAGGGLTPAVVAGYMALTIMIVLPITYRMSIKLPAIALGRKDFRFGDAWNVSRGNMTRLMLLGVLCSGVAFAVSASMGLLEQGLTYLGGETMAWLFMAARQLLGWLFGIFTITMFTSLYGFFVEQRDF